MPAPTRRALLASALVATALVAAPDLAGAQSEGTIDGAIIWHPRTPDFIEAATSRTPLVEQLESCLGKLRYTDLGYKATCTVAELEQAARRLPDRDEHWATGGYLLLRTAGAVVHHAAAGGCCIAGLQRFAQRVEHVYGAGLRSDPFGLELAQEALDLAARVAAVIQAERASDPALLAAALDVLARRPQSDGWVRPFEFGLASSELERLASRLRNHRKLAGARDVLSLLTPDQSNWGYERWALESDLARLQGLPELARTQLDVAETKRRSYNAVLPFLWEPEGAPIRVLQSMVECGLTALRCHASPATPGWITLAASILWPEWEREPMSLRRYAFAKWEALISTDLPRVAGADPDVAPWRVRHARRLCAGSSPDCDALLAAAEGWSLQWPEDAVLAREVTLLRVSLAAGAVGFEAEELRDHVRGALEGFVAERQFENDPELLAARAELWLHDLEWRTK